MAPSHQNLNTASKQNVILDLLPEYLRSVASTRIGWSILRIKPHETKNNVTKLRTSS